MITQYRFALKGSNPLRSAAAYHLYAWLLAQLPCEFGDLLHEQGETPLSQFLYYDRQLQCMVWVVNLLGEETEQSLSAVLCRCPEIILREGRFIAQTLTVTSFDTPEDFLICARKKPQLRLSTLNIVTPAAFKQQGRYTIFPSERLLLQSLLMKWNRSFPDYPMEDEDALRMLEEGLHITDYRLRSVRYPLKQTKVAGFQGELRLEAKMSPPIAELWNILKEFSAYSGIGIKTTLGMGGVLLPDGEALNAF